ncbi:hypothetical protein F4778DRAFT_279378 [Xylariomycetidae sp. FL2044]|nr:hypothetical protein F4778DRAFT_279378 [Xylariomycetidae sp. FL2044]
MAQMDLEAPADLSVSSNNQQPVVRALGGSIFEVTISKRNRFDFFSESAGRLSDNCEEAEIVLHNLSIWSPDLAENFTIRTPETVLSTPFRLVCESDLGHVPFDDEKILRQFLAISYCWRHDGEDWPGDGSQPHAPWPFSRPFVDAILAQRGVHTADPGYRDANFRREGIWVDQMCIRQEDNVEKQQSIAMMDMIYERCRRLLVLLEDVTFSPEEIDVIEKYHISWTPNEADVLPLASLCNKVENSRWWSRSWCWHEIEANKPWSDMRHNLAAHNAVFIVKNASGGTYGLKYLALQSARHATMNLLSTAAGEGLLPKLLRWTIGDNKISPYHDPMRRRRGTERSSLMGRYFAGSLTGCQIASDIISIAINLSGLGLSFTAQFFDRDKAFFDIAMLALACGETRPLTWMSSATDPPLIINGCISWLSRPAGGLDTTLPKFAVGSVEHVHGMTYEHIELDLLFFETPAESPSEEDIEATYDVFPDTPIRTRKVELADMRYNQDVEENNDNNLSDRGRRMFLALACRNGLADICRLWEMLDREVIQPSFNNVRFQPFASDELLRPGARKLLGRLSPVSGTPASKSQQDMEGVLLSLLTFITDPRSLYYLTPLPTRVQCNHEASAIIGCPVLKQRSESYDPDKCRLAIPLDLINTSSTVPRLWVLYPVEASSSADQTDSAGHGDTSTRWRLIGKSLLLGEPPLLPAGSHAEARRFASIRRRQFVQG